MLAEQRPADLEIRRVTADQEQQFAVRGDVLGAGDRRVEVAGPVARASSAIRRANDGFNRA